MSFWWVNHKQTAKNEIGEGYIWSPQRKKDGSRNEAYINLTRVKRGETIFSYANGVIPAIGIVESEYKTEPKPISFGSAGEHWDDQGWMVKVKWVRLETPIRPKNFLNQIAPLLPQKYSPLQANGNGNQSQYLTQINEELAQLLMRLLSDKDTNLPDALNDVENELEESKEEEDIKQSILPETQREQLIQARLGQGLFRANVESIESRCRVTGLADKRLLVASHIKPWRDATNAERLDGCNGFLMSPHVDKLFDKGWISFSDAGRILLADRNIRAVLSIWAIDEYKGVGSFSKRQRGYLEYHRDVILKK
jgi:putative restriction endonuclease